MKGTKTFVLLGAAFGGYVVYALVAITDRLLSWWTPLHAAISIALVICVWGLWKAKRWAWRLSLFLALAAFGFGCYVAHFVWTFWIFEKPTLLDRLLDELHPRVSVFWIFPVVWILYFTRRRVREQFK